MKNYLNFINEETYNIDLNTGETDYNYIGKNKGRFNRLKHLVYQIEQSGSPLEGEKVSEILLGATNLNTLDLNYPFVDLKVISPVKGVTVNNELISVKTSRDKHTLAEAVTYVNGFKIGQLIQFAISKINFKIFKSDIFKTRFSIKLSSITSYYQKTISKLFSDDKTIYTYAFVNEIVILKFMKDYFNYLSGVEHIIEKNRNKLYSIMSACIAGFIDKKFGTNYIDSLGVSIEIVDSVKKYLSIPNKNYDFTSDYLNYGEGLPDDIKNLKISYCILYFNESDDGEIILNLHKTHAVNFSDLFDKSMKLWIKKGYHNPESIKKNFYLNYQGVIEAFSTGSNDNVFDTHIKVKISADYEERTEKIKKLYIKVINNVKGIGDEDKESQEKILKLLNKYLNKVNTSNKKNRDRYIQKFSEIFK